MKSLKKDELVDRLDRRLGRLKRDELEKLVESVESGRVDLAAMSAPAGGTAPRRAETPARAPARRGGQLKLKSLNDVLMEQIKDLYSAERQLVDALPKVAGAASNPELREAFTQHLDQTQSHMRRLERIFGDVGITGPTEQCEGMAGLIGESESIVAATGEATAKDAALIAAAQRVEHYEIAGYGTARALAGELGLDEAERLLDQTLNEESQTNERLTRIATGGWLSGGVNERAAES